MNFWRPSSINEFKAITPGELFLFKLKFPENKIVGGAYFVRHSRKIKEEFSNGREYYAYHGSQLKGLPKESSERPAKEFLEWHQSHFLS
jgi:hypothetical protein